MRRLLVGAVVVAIQLLAPGAAAGDPLEMPAPRRLPEGITLGGVLVVALPEPRADEPAPLARPAEVVPPAMPGCPDRRDAVGCDAVLAGTVSRVLRDLARWRLVVAPMRGLDQAVPGLAMVTSF
jgi:hypothetical protein